MIAYLSHLSIILVLTLCYLASGIEAGLDTDRLGRQYGKWAQETQATIDMTAQEVRQTVEEFIQDRQMEWLGNSEFSPLERTQSEPSLPSLEVTRRNRRKPSASAPSNRVPGKTCVCVAGGAVAVAVRYYLAHDEQARMCLLKAGECARQQCTRLVGQSAGLVTGALRAGSSICLRVLNVGRRALMVPLTATARILRQHRDTLESLENPLREFVDDLYRPMENVSPKARRLREYSARSISPPTSRVSGSVNNYLDANPLREFVDDFYRSTENMSPKAHRLREYSTRSISPSTSRVSGSVYDYLDANSF